MATASADPEIRRYNGVHDRHGRPAPALSIGEADEAIDRFTMSWQELAGTGNATGVAFAIADATSGELVGGCGVDDWSKEDVAQFGYWVAAPARGQGCATRAATLLTRWLFERGAARVFCTVVAHNHGSAAVARGAGFEHEGTMRDYGVWQGQRCDVMVFAALRNEWAPSAQPLIGAGDPNPQRRRTSLGAANDASCHPPVANVMGDQPARQSAEGEAPVITLCGSTEFEAEFAEVNERLTMEGCVVISLGMFSLPELPDHDWAADGSDLKVRLGHVHFQKIRMADEVYVVDPGGYVGESTRREIAYARSLGKPVRYLSREHSARGRPT